MQVSNVHLMKANFELLHRFIFEFRKSITGQHYKDQTNDLLRRHHHMCVGSQNANQRQSLLLVYILPEKRILNETKTSFFSHHY